MKDSQPLQERFAVTLQLYELAEQMLRQRLRREQPELTGAELESRVNDWRLDRPGAEQGDAEGTLGRWPRDRT